MPYLLTVATDDDRRVLVESLRAGADQRTRVARRAAGDVADQRRAGKDARSSAMKIAALLDEANTLAQAADALAASSDVLMIRAAVGSGGLTVADADGTETVLGAAPTQDPAEPDDDDGTSPEAQALAEAAGLTSDPDPDVGEDELGALPEDVPAIPEKVL